MSTGVLSILTPGDVLPAPTDFFVGPVLRPALTRFYLGPENLLAHHVVEVIQSKRLQQYSPLVLVGPQGIGKSHLTQGCVEAWRQAGQRGSTVMLCARQFVREWIAAVRQDRADQLRTQLRQASLLVLENLEHLAKHESASREILMTLDELHRQGAVVLVTTRSEPNRIVSLCPGLASRLTAGLVVQLAEPSRATRLAIVEAAADPLGVSFTRSAAQMLANTLPGTVPQLLGHLNAVAAGEPLVDRTAVERYLKAQQAVKAPPITTIISTTAKYFSMPVARLKGASRNRTVVSARAIAMYLARDLTNHSLEKIGAQFGGRDHTTVLHNCRRIEQRLESEPEIRQAVSEVRDRVIA